MNEWDVLDEFEDLKKEISTSFTGNQAYKNLCDELAKGQRLITAITSNGPSNSERGERQSDYKICFDKGVREEPFSVLDGKNLCSSGCYITGVDDNVSNTGEVRRIRLYLSKACTGAQQKVDGGVTKYYYDLVWPTGDSGTDWTPPDPDKDPKHNYKEKGGDYTLAEIGCAGMSTSATGLKISGTGLSVGVTGVSVSCSVAAFCFGGLLVKGVGLDYSVEACGTRSAAFENKLEEVRLSIELYQILNQILQLLSAANENGDVDNDD